MLRDQIERYNQRLRDFEDKQRVYRSHQQLDRPGDTDIEVSLVSTFLIHESLIKVDESLQKATIWLKLQEAHQNVYIFGLHADNISAVFSLENLLQVLPIQIWPHLIFNFCLLRQSSVIDFVTAYFKTQNALLLHLGNIFVPIFCGCQKG
jgi:hypothetical protein